MHYIALKQEAGPLSIRTRTGSYPQLPEGPLEPSAAAIRLRVEYCQAAIVLNIEMRT